MEPGDIIQVKFVTRLDDQTAYNVRHWQVVNKAGTGATIAQFMDAINTVFRTDYLAVLNANAEYRGVTCQRVYPLPADNEVFQSDPDIGAVAGDPLPRQTCGLISLRTGIAGKRNRGRVYIPFPSEADSNATPAPSATYITRLGTLGGLFTTAVAWGTAPNTNQAVPVIYHRDNHTVVPLQSFLVRSAWATQRRRGDFGRPNLSPV